MSTRTYLSIGDVLALLRQEFPDVTISKIRFLESQGLVNPERTPSGYRKFYEHDVERLRWVLRQQREHFLPLKVIKGRLEEGAGNGELASAGGGDAGHPEPALVGGAGGPSGPRAAGRELPGFEARPAETTRRGPDGGTGPGAGGGMRSRPLVPAATTLASAPATAPPRVGGARPDVGAPSRDAGPTGPGRAAPGPVARPGTPVPGTRGASSGAPTPTKVSGEAAMGATAVGPRSGHGAVHAHVEGADGDGGDDSDVGALSGPRMTTQELAAGSGLDVAAVEALESFGLVCGRVVGGVPYYDEDALIVAQVAAGLAPYGVEARHLRLHKHAAEREAAFIEQIVLPLLKQRNPEARQRAHDIVAELTVLGQRLREVLLRATLRDQLGG